MTNVFQIVAVSLFSAKSIDPQVIVLSCRENRMPP